MAVDEMWRTAVGFQVQTLIRRKIVKYIYFFFVDKTYSARKNSCDRGQNKTNKKILFFSLSLIRFRNWSFFFFCFLYIKYGLGGIPSERPRRVVMMIIHRFARKTIPIIGPRQACLSDYVCR